ncbi:ABC transporter substrate-binding protein [Actinospica sp.]|jgi:peptide/nickel transport system substrate-binding protein|uniref:ABC transporter substrate-binding protein n=1 Tax=Actinospica sp. TaxID=1872142 RepID=UPI002D7FB515|nr:ABC transporter substrate-binding protein [Actinospica sp.]
MVAAVGLTLAACGNSSGGSSSAGAGYNAALTSVVNASSSTTGNVVLEDASALQSADPNATYDATDWNVSRLWARTMLAFDEQPGKASNSITEDLSTGLGKSSNNNQTWTYTVRDGVKFSNGDPVTALDVAYSISRSGGWGSIITGGPSYFKEYINNTNTKAGTLETSASQVPSLLPSGITVSGQTITFKLNQPVSDFDYLMTLPETAPFDIQAGADQGTSYANHVISSSSYEVQSYSPDSQMVLVPNPNYSSSTDPNNLHKVHAAKITIKVNVSQTTIDQDILHSRAQADIGAVGVDTSSQGTILGNPTDKALADDPVDGFEDYLALNTQVAPLDNLDCRQAIEYAINKAQVQSVAGGAIGAGQIATTIIPPTVNGYVDTNVYATGGNIGDVSKAKGLVSSCQTAEGSKWNPTVNVSAFSDQPKNVDMSNAIVTELNAIGFTSSVKQFKFSNWGTTIGNFSWEKSNRVLVANAAWGPDFPDGNGFLQFMVGSAGVNYSSNASNYSYWSDNTFMGYLKQAEETSDSSARNALWAKADAYALQQAVIVPLLDATALDVRSKNATNVYFMDAYGAYDFAAIGATG